MAEPTTTRELPICGCCGLWSVECVCDDPAFVECVNDRDRDSIIHEIARRRSAEADRDELLDVAERIAQADLRHHGSGLPHDNKRWAETDALLRSVIANVKQHKDAHNA